jgi:hypothetical protein
MPNEFKRKSIIISNFAGYYKIQNYPQALRIFFKKLFFFFPLAMGMAGTLFLLNGDFIYSALRPFFKSNYYGVSVDDVIAEFIFNLVLIFYAFLSAWVFIVLAYKKENRSQIFFRALISLGFFATLFLSILIASGLFILLDR